MRNGNQKRGVVHYHMIIVLTVPMRNGNMITFFAIASQSVCVLTVPMRNGNKVELPQLEETVNQFLPYL